MVAEKDWSDKEPTATNNLSEHICEDVGDIEEHLRGHRLRWLGHLEGKNSKDLTRRVREEKITGNVKTR